MNGTKAASVRAGAAGNKKGHRSVTEKMVALFQNGDFGCEVFNQRYIPQLSKETFAKMAARPLRRV
jgi:hypothetical protein